MKPLTIADSPRIILGLQDEIRRSEESRYDHRLHGVLLVAQGMTCPEVAHLLGERHDRWNIGSVVLKETVWRDCWRANDRGGPDA
jgi:hypothetical protein